MILKCKRPIKIKPGTYACRVIHTHIRVGPLALVDANWNLA